MGSSPRAAPGPETVSPTPSLSGWLTADVTLTRLHIKYVFSSKAHQNHRCHLAWLTPSLEH